MPNNTPAPADLMEAVIAVVRDQLMSTDYPVNDFERGFADKIIAAYHAHMASDGVVQADRDAAAAYLSAIVTDMPRLAERVAENETALARAFAAHRRAAASGVGCSNPDAWLYRPWADDDLWLCQMVEPQGEGYAEKRPLYATPQPDPRDADCCPTCESHQPHLHPSTGVEGEATFCPDAFHLRKTPQNKPEYITQVEKARTGSRQPDKRDALIAELREALIDAIKSLEQVYPNPAPKGQINRARTALANSEGKA